MVDFLCHRMGVRTQPKENASKVLDHAGKVGLHPSIQNLLAVILHATIQAHSSEVSLITGRLGW